MALKKLKKKIKKDKDDDLFEESEEETEQQVPSSSSAPTPKSSSSSSPVAPSKTPSEPTLGAGDVSATLKETKSLSSLHLERNSVLIQVVGCKELKNVDIIGKSDPWVKIKVLDRSGVKQRSFKTKRIDNNLNPVWDQDFMFVFRFGTTIDDYLVQFEVYDHDRTTDTFLGICIQPMANIMGKRPGRIMECKLEPKKSGQNVKGTIQFSVRYPSPQEIEELGANFTSKVAKSLVNYITYSMADAICKLRPDAAIFECEAEVTILNIVFIYILNILIPSGAPSDLYEIKKDMTYEALKASVCAKTSSKGKAFVGSLPNDTQKILKNFTPKFLDQVVPILNSSRKAPASSGGTEVQMGVGVKPIIRIPPPPAPPVIGAEIALRVIFASMGKDGPAPPPTAFSAMAVARDQPVPGSGNTSSPSTPQKPSRDSSKTEVSPPAGSDSGVDEWKPEGENLGIFDIENNSLIIRVEDVKGLQHKGMTGSCKPFVVVEVTDRSGNVSKKFKSGVKDGQDVTFDEDFLYLFPFGRAKEDLIATFSVYHHSIKGKKFLGQCTRPVIDIMGSNPEGGETCEMTLQPKKAGDYVKGSVTFSIRKPCGNEIEDLGSAVSAKVTKHLVSYILYSCADAIVKGATLPSCVRFECEAEITVFNICFIFVVNVSIPYGTPASTFETNKAVAYENLRVSVATKGVPKLFANVPESSQKMVDSYLPRFMDQLMIMIEGARKPMGGEPIYMELGVGMKPGFTLPLPPNPPVITGEIAFRVFLGAGGRERDMSVPGKTFASITNRTDEVAQRKQAAEVIIQETKAGVDAPEHGVGALDLEKGSVLITIVRANDLRNVDMVGKSDPWVKIRILESSGEKVKKFSTKTIDNDLNPVWNEKFLLIFPFNRTAEDLVLVLEVYDKGLKGRKFLGMCEQSMANILRTDTGNVVEMTLQPKKKGDHVKGTIQFSVSRPTKEDIEELGVDMPSKLAKCLIQYIAFAFANAIVKMKPKNARFECEAEFSVFGLCFIFCATVVIPLGTEIDVFECKRDQAYEMLEACVATQSKKFMQKIPKNAKAMLDSFLPRFMEQATPLVEASRKPSEHKIQAQMGIGIKPEFVLPFPPSPPIVTGSVALRAVFGLGGDVSAAPFRGFAFHQTMGAVPNEELREIPQ